MRNFHHTIFLLLIISFARTLSAQIPPGTGAVGEGILEDPNFQLVTEMVSPHQLAGCPASVAPCPSRSTPASVVIKPADWAPELPGTHWIAPHPNQSSDPRRGGQLGPVTYQTQFQGTQDLALNARVLADDSVVVSLNGRVVYTSSGPRRLAAAMVPLTGFVNGTNTITFVVSNDHGGPAGLDVAFSDAQAAPAGPILAFHHHASPDAMAFAPTVVGDTSRQTLQVFNNGDTVATFAAIGPATGAFSIDPKTQGCGAPLAPGEFCTFDIVFSPKDLTPQEGTLRISLNGSANPRSYVVNLAGTGTPVSATSYPSLVFSPASLTFPATPAGKVSAEQLVKITSIGSSPAVFSKAYIPSNYSINWKPKLLDNGIPPCPGPETFDKSTTIPAGGSCAIGITFNPTTGPVVVPPETGVALGIDLCVPCEGTLYTMPLSGKIGDGPILTFFPNPLIFPDTPAGSASAPMTVTVVNSGTKDGTISQLPTGNAIFAYSSPASSVCVPAVAAGRTCAMQFTFKPPAGTPAGTVLRADPLGNPANPLKLFVAESDIPFVLSASGKVSAAANGPAVTVSPNPMEFSQVPGQSVTKTLTITNSGNAPLIIDTFVGYDTTLGFQPAGTNCLDGPIAPGSSCSVSLTFTPTHIGSVTTPFVILDNATPPRQTVTLNGVGLGPVVQLDRDVVNLTGTVGGPTPSQTVTLTNIGTADLHISDVRTGAGVNGDVTGFSKTSDTCLGKTIKPQGSCQMVFVFNPGTIGPSQTTVTITDDADPTTQTITLRGSISGAAILVTVPDTSTDGACQRKSVQSATGPATTVTCSTIINTPPVGTSITITNAGSVDITIQNIKLGTSGIGFVLGDLTPCFSHPLKAGTSGQFGDSCKFPITFNRSTETVLVQNSITITATPPNPPSPPLAVTINLEGVAVQPPTGPPETIPPTGTRHVLDVNAAPDPVDGGTGQFYEYDMDLDLGGPFQLQFVRYYGSGLSAGGYQNSLGLNWMSNFDVSMALKGNTAQVLLFGGRSLTFTKSGSGWTLTSPPDIGYQFAAAGSGYQLMSPASGLIYTFNVLGKLSSVADGKGNVLTVTQGANGPVSISDDLGRTLTLTYSGGHLTSVLDQSGRAVTYTYSGNLMASATDAAQRTTLYTYTTAGALAGLMTKKQLPAGNVPTTQNYDSAGRVVTQIDADGNATQIAYDGKGGTAITGPMGDITQQGHAASGALSQLTDPMGKSLNVTLDSADHRSSVTDKLGNVVKFSYHAPTGRMASRTDELGNTTSYTYTPRTQGGFTFYDLTGIAFADGTSTSMSYDTNGNITSLTAQDGTTQTWTYDKAGRVSASTDTNNQTTTFAYYSDGTLASRQDPLRNKSTYSYTATGRLSKINDPDGGVSALTYDADGNLLTLTDPAGAAMLYRYDDNGRRSTFVNPYGGAFSFTYTPADTLASLVDPLGNKTLYAYDPEGRLKSVTNAAGEAILRTYDAAGRLLALADNQGPRMNFTYDAEGHIVSQTDPTGRTTTFSYDAVGRLTGTVKPDQTKYAFGYDKMGRLLSLTNPLGETQSLTLDAMGRATKVSLPGGLNSTVGFDTLGRTASITSPNGNTWTFSRDALGRIAATTDPLGNTTTRSYTGTLLTGMTFPLGTLTYTRDKAGRVTQRQYSDGTAIKTAFDAMGLLTSADGVSIQRDKMGHPVNMNGMALTHTPAGRMASVTYATGKTLTYAYDSAGRLSMITDWVGGQTTFSYDAASRLTGLTYPNSVATTYSYDTNGRLIGIQAGSLSSIALTLDADGKITSADRSVSAPALQAAAQQFSYNAAAQIAGEQFDTMGRALTQSGRSYTWNLASQLTAFQDSSVSGSLTYDGLGELASSNASGTTRNFIFNHATGLPALSIVRQGGKDLRYYVYTPGGNLLYSIEADGGARRFYHFDEMGNTTMLTGDDGAVTDTYAITPYGEFADQNGSTDNPFTWQGKYGIIQEAPGLYFMRKRHYDAAAARFLSPDPLTTPDPRSAEPYIYARGNPLYYIDPTGALTWALITQFQEELQALDNDIPDAFNSAALVILNPFDVNAQFMYGLIISHPGLTWWQLHYLADNTDFNALLWPPPPTNSNALASCLKLHTCDPRETAALTVLVERGQGSQVALPATALISSGLANVISNDGGSLVSHDGGSLVSHDGGSLVSHDGGSLIGQDGSSLISQDGLGIVSQGAGNIVSQGAGNIVSQGAGNIVSQGAGNIVSQGAGNIVSQGAGNIVSQGAGNAIGGMGR